MSGTDPKPRTGATDPGLANPERAGGGQYEAKIQDIIESWKTANRSARVSAAARHVLHDLEPGDKFGPLTTTYIESLQKSPEELEGRLDEIRQQAAESLKRQLADSTFPASAIVDNILALYQSGIFECADLDIDSDEIRKTIERYRAMVNKFNAATERGPVFTRSLGDPTYTHEEHVDYFGRTSKYDESGIYGYNSAPDRPTLHIEVEIIKPYICPVLTRSDNDESYEIEYYTDVLGEDEVLKIVRAMIKRSPDAIADLNNKKVTVEAIDNDENRSDFTAAKKTLLDEINNLVRRFGLFKIDRSTSKENPLYPSYDEELHQAINQIEDLRAQIEAVEVV
ncbi:MAG: hypothetical protein LBM73_03820 [Candidatus Nomurabacteria bacterium]|jgi:hypothetical protein|nr:hypothetical protein [Candidatus Nomurabacteria bacterium]